MVVVEVLFSCEPSGVSTFVLELALDPDGPL